MESKSIDIVIIRKNIETYQELIEKYYNRPDLIEDLIGCLDALHHQIIDRLKK